MGWLNRRRREESSPDDESTQQTSVPGAASDDVGHPESEAEPSWTVEIPAPESAVTDPAAGPTGADLLSQLLTDRASDGESDLSSFADVHKDGNGLGTAAGDVAPELEGDLAREAESHAVDDPDGPFRPTDSTGEYSPMALDTIIQQLLAIDGAIGAAVIDSESGMALAQGGSPGFDLGVAAAGNSNVVRAKLATMKEIGLDGKIDDILITLDAQYHLINVLDTPATRGLFIYLVLDRSRANLALARHRLRAIAPSVEI